MRYELATAGERLANLVSTKLLADVQWAKLGTALRRTGRSEQLLEFIEELAVIHVTCRIVVTGISLLKAREGRQYPRDPEDPTFQADYRQFLRESLQIPRVDLDLIYRQAERALKAVSNDITAKESNRLRNAAKRHNASCYMCGVPLNFDKFEPAPDGETAEYRASRERRNAQLYTCEHIWPQSFGGSPTCC
jgi:hypothetical protein